MATAYAIGFLLPNENGEYVLRSIGIRSEGPNTLTHVGGGEVYVQLLQLEAETFGEANVQLRRVLENWYSKLAHLFEWNGR